MASELLQTEQNYIKSIDEVVSGLIRPVERANEQKSPILKHDEFHAVFSNLKDLSKAHKELLKLLEDRIASNWTDQSIVGDIFIQKVKFVSSYFYKHLLILFRLFCSR